MNDLRNQPERIIHELIIEVLDAFGRTKISRPDYQRGMGYLRDVDRLLTNRQFGCASGKHAGDCECL